MSEEMRELGALLKAKRSEMHLSHKEIENGTSIRTAYLEAIEEGKIDQFVSAIYAQGFMKQYATFLGLDSEELLKNYPSAFHVPVEKHEFSYGIGTLEARNNVGGGIKWVPNLLMGGVVVMVLILGWYLAKALGIF